MAAPSAPNNFAVQTANQKILSSWNQTTGATSYTLQRSEDNVTFADIVTLSGTPLATSYIDDTVSVGTEYWYKVLASNIDGDSSYTSSSSAIPSPTGEKSLKQIRLESRQRADRENSEFVTDPELNTFINKAMYELYDLLITVYEDYNVATPIQFTTNGTSNAYSLPNGSNTFTDSITQETVTPQPYYKLLGLDLAVQNSNNGWVTINKYNFIDRNRFVYPNTASTIYGVFNMQYRVMGSNIQFIPTPSSAQTIRVWYIPRLTELLADTDTTDIGISGWLEYVIARTAKYILDKEESDTSTLDAEIIYLKERIESSASNRDAGQPDKISDTRGGNQGGWGIGWNGGSGGF